MDYRTLGRSGCAVSNLALGTMTFGAETSELDAHTQLDRCPASSGTEGQENDALPALTQAAEQLVSTHLARIRVAKREHPRRCRPRRCHEAILPWRLLARRDSVFLRRKVAGWITALWATVVARCRIWPWAR